MVRTLFAALVLVLAAACGGSDGSPGGAGGSGAVGGGGGSGGSGGTGGDAGTGGSGGDGGTGGTAGTGGSGGTGGTGGSTTYTELLIQIDGFCADGCNFMHRGDTRLLYGVGVDAQEEWHVLEGPQAWRSDDESVVVIDAEGTLTAVGVGETSVWLEAEGLEASIRVFVDPPLVAKVVADPGSLELAPGETATVTAEGFDLDGNPIDDAEFFVESANPNVATVAEDGTITAVGGGITWVRVSAAQGTPGSEAMVVVEVAGAMPDGVSFALVDVGASHACAIGDGGEAWCWGWNFFGQLAISPEEMLEADSPQLVDAGRPFASIVAGDSHTCALEATGDAWCWGVNDSGQLGLDDEDDRIPGTWDPMPVAGFHSFATISVGGSHTCALDGDGAASCWGANFAGQVGSGDEEAWEIRTPTQVAGGHVFTTIAATLWSTCALDEDGAAWCWGDNYQGTLGDDGVHDRSYVPVAVVGGRAFSSLDGSANHYCGLTADGKAWCWGDNYSGQLGIENPSEFEWISRVPVMVQGGHAFVEIAAGAHHTCGIDRAGDTWCFGNGDYGQLGSGLPQYAGPLPILVAGDHSFVSLSAANNTTCGLEADGAAFCWGDNSSGHLGGGWNYGLSPVPWPVTGL